MKRNLVYVVLTIGAVAQLLVGCAAENKSVANGGTDPEPVCEEGEFTCEGSDYMECTDGQWVLSETCADVCVDHLGCVECFPGDTMCDGDLVMACSQNGSGYYVQQDCTDWNTTCQDGECYFADPCDAALAQKSNIGCEYWAVDLDNAENSFDDAAGGQFAVAVANIGSNGTADVKVHINTSEQGQSIATQLVEEKDVAEGELHIFRLPRRDADGDNITTHFDDGPQTWLSSRAFRITSSVPVVAYQFNTLDQQFSNDASLLLPTSGLGKDHLVTGFSPGAPVASLGKNRGYITIVGTEPGTEVTVTTTAPIEAGLGVDEIPEGVPTTFTIGEFDVLNLETKLYTITQMMFGAKTDLTGSVVSSDKPVAVFFGVDLTAISPGGDDQGCCAEHIEQQIIPSFAMGQDFVVSHSAARTSGSVFEMDYYRIMSYEGATVTTSLPAPNNQFTLAPGEFREFFVNTGFTATTDDGYLHIAQYLVQRTDTDQDIGDSSLLYVPSVDQRRGLYVFTTGSGFSSNYAVISKPQGMAAKIDGNDVDTSSSCSGPRIDGVLDGTTYESWTCEISDGVHEVHSGDTPEEATMDLGVFVYGYYNAGSYAYPAGSDLRHTNEAVIE